MEDIQEDRSPAPRASRRNFAIMFTDAMGYFVGITFFSPQTILQEFVTRLTGSNVLIGLTTSIAWSGSTITQLAISNYIEQLPIKRWYVAIVATFERLPLLAVVILTPIWSTSRPKAMLAVLFCAIGTQYLVTGLVVPAFSALYSKVIPARQRGLLFGLSTSLANVVKIGAGLLIPIVLTANAWWGGFPNGYAVCFLVGFVVLMAGYIPLAFTDEAPDEPTGEDRSAKGYTLAVWRILRHDRDFQYFSLFGWFSVFGVSATAFYVTYSIRELGSPEGESGWFTVLMSVGTLASLYWGVLADRTNNRVVLFLCSVLTMIAPIWAIFAPGRLSFYPVIVITAAAMSGLELAGYNVQLEFSPPARVPRYVALFAAIQFLPLLAAPLIGGVLADAFGFKAVFAVSALSSLAAVIVITRMRDPRGRSEAVTPPTSDALTHEPGTSYPMNVR